MWYFKSSTRRCEYFDYGGCEGNANRFQSAEECERTCYPYMSSATTEAEPNIPTDICEAEKLRCKQLSEEPLRCPYGLEKRVNSVGCDDCRCYNPCSTGTDQKSLCPAGYQCIVEVFTTDSGEQSYKQKCRQGILINRAHNNYLRYQ